MPLIAVKYLSKIYSNEGTETQALRDVSCAIEHGEFVAIMGPSGSGKSTLLHILGFLERESGGEYFFQGKLSKKYTDDELALTRNREMGFIFQSFHLLAKTNALENVLLPLLYSQVPKTEWNSLAKKTLDAIGLSQRMYHKSSQLSGGERQRVAIARALVNHPKVIFADEPTGNLDSKSGETVMEIFQNLHAQKSYTIILVTHDPHVAQYADRIITMRDGKIETDRNSKNV